MKKKIALLIFLFNRQILSMEETVGTTFHANQDPEEIDIVSSNFEDPLIWSEVFLIEKVTLTKCALFLQYLIMLKKKEAVEKYKAELKKDKDLKIIIESFDDIFSRVHFCNYSLYYRNIYSHLEKMEYSSIKDLPTPDQFNQLR